MSDNCNPREGGQPWNDRQMRAKVLEEARHRPRVPICDADLDNVTGTYLLFLNVNEPTRRSRGRASVALFGPLLRGVRPVYIGSTTNLRSRANRHLRTLDGDRGFTAEEVWISWIPSASHAAALYMERSLQTATRPLLNTPRLSGFGSRPPGAGRLRGQRRISGWDSLFPAARWARPPTALEHARAVVDVAAAVSGMDLSQPWWPPIEPTDP